MKLENQRINNIFSKKKTRQGMDLRKYEKIETKFGKTKRLKNSSLPYLQRNLNSENLEYEKPKLKRKIIFHGVKNILK